MDWARVGKHGIDEARALARRKHGMAGDATEMTESEHDVGWKARNRWATISEEHETSWREKAGDGEERLRMDAAKVRVSETYKGLEERNRFIQVVGWSQVDGGRSVGNVAGFGRSDATQTRVSKCRVCWKARNLSM